MIKVLDYTKDYKTDWVNYVAKSTRSTVCHQIEWIDIISQSLGHSPRYIIAMENGKLCGLLPLFLVKTWWNSRFLVSIPWLDYGGIIADTDEIERAICDYAQKLAIQEKVEFVEYRSIEAKFDEMSKRTDKVTFQMDLNPGEEALWKGFHFKLRNHIRKSEKSGVTTEFGNTELLDRFYTVFQHNMRDLGTPVWGRSLFENILTTFKDQAWIILVNREQETIAGGLVLSFKDHLYVPSASSYRAIRSYRPNHALYWSVIKKGCNEGYKVFDFGRSTKDAPTFTFKKQWVPVPMQLNWQYYMHKGKVPPSSEGQDNKFGLMVNIWRRLPLPVANLLGPRVIKNFP